MKNYDPPRRAGSIVMSPDWEPREPTRQETLVLILNVLNERIRGLDSIRGRLDLFDEELPVGAANALTTSGGRQRVFLVHGHDARLKHETARTIQQLTGHDPIILHEQSDGRRTIIEKFEAFAAEVAAAVILLTPDDEGRVRSSTGDSELRPRARQNVVYELGWFDGRLTRGRVIALYVEGVELPSDLAGVLYIPIDAGGSWKMRLGFELRTAGLAIDLNNIVP